MIGKYSDIVFGKNNSCLAFVFSSIKPFKKLLKMQFCIAFFWAIDISLRPYLIKLLIDRLSKFENSTTINFFMPALGYIFLSFIILTIYRIHDWLSLKFYPPLKKYLCHLIMEKLLLNSFHFHQSNLPGETVSKIDNLIEGCVMIVRLLLNQAVGQILAISLAVYAIGQNLGIKFSLALIGWVTLYVTYILLSFRKADELTMRTSKSQAKISGHIVDVLQNIKSIKIFNRALFEVENINEKYDEYINNSNKSEWFFLKMFSVQGLLFLGYQTFCILFLLLDFQQNKISVGDFALVLMINMSLLECFQGLSMSFSLISRSFSDIRNGITLINKTAEREDLLKEDLILCSGNIKARNLSFKYDEKHVIFHDQNIEIRPKEKLGIVGYSGSGKSTFSDLLIRLQKPDDGAILIDKQNIANFSYNSLREIITVVPQDPILFHRSVLDNIGYGKAGASMSSIIKAASVACAHEFITELPGEYSTIIGSKGIKLSGGEKQRIAIARAVLRDSPILILDESTSQLDSIIERKIYKNIILARKKKTTVIISHNLSLMEEMDRVIVFDKGKIVQEGLHSNLCTTSGIYKNLWESHKTSAPST